jgi:hypothetical protein
MPYSIKKGKGPRPWKIIKVDTKQVVGTSKTKKNAVGSIIHRENAEKE